MANMVKITVSKLKGFRLNAICVVMIIAAVTRTVMTGESIWLTGVCAVALPFICQARRWPQSPEGTSRIVDATSTFLMNVVLMVAYLAILFVVTYAAYTWAPFYVVDERFFQKLMLVVCGNVVFISALCLISQSLDTSQRMLAGVVLCNGELGYSFIMAKAVDAGLLDGCYIPAAIFCAVVVIMAFVLLLSGKKMASREKDATAKASFKPARQH